MELIWGIAALKLACGLDDRQYNVHNRMEEMAGNRMCSPKSELV